MSAPNVHAESRPSAPVPLTLDLAVFESAIAELAVALRTSGVSEGVTKDVRHLLEQSPAQFFAIEGPATHSASEVRFRLEVTDAYRSLLRAVRAGEGDLRVFVVGEAHDTSREPSS